ncbi:MAG TPA: DNA repair protein RecN [Saprospiraceae bacterium]|nr:DNA repair protein RecN [Saprospiraceae bacterium]
MILRLLIKNYAIITEQEIEFSDRLTIITGETGAGKSILLGALGLIMGKRADTKSLYDDSKKCIVEANFDIAKYGLKNFFDENDIDYEEELLVRREITPSGKSRAFVNDTPVKLKLLQKLSGSLIDLHQQFDTLDIHNVSFQLRMIDALANNKKLLLSYEKKYKQYQADKRQLSKLIEQNDSASKEVDFLHFQLEEFNQSALVADEQEKLETEQGKLTNAEDIKKYLNAAFQRLSEDEQSILNQLNELSLHLSNLKKYHPNLANATQRFDGIILELQDLAQEFESIAADTEYDGERILEIQQRLDLIYKLQNKYRVNSVEELLSIQHELENRLANIGDLSSEIERLELSIQQQESELSKIAKELSKNRKAIIPDFEAKVHKLLAKLSMQHARLKVEVKKLDHLAAMGMDEIEFLFAPNVGSRFMSIKDVASGGELSRLTLCTKSLVASAIPLPTLIFDEIDTGISGDVALKMGTILHKLANRHQVISITHTPQIAVKADRHYFVYKAVRDQKTITNVKLLSMDERIRAVATMLSGSPPSSSAIENAKELLKQ